MKWIGFLFLVLLAGFFLFQERSAEPDSESSPNSSAPIEEVKEDGPPVRFVGLNNPINEEYGHPDKGVANDLKVVTFLLHDCQLIIKDFDSYFLPENREIIAFLSGKNRDRLAWIAKDHQFVNEEGELVDRWGTPLFFHRESGFHFELRSAGPDRKHWTEDDISTKPQGTK